MEARFGSFVHFLICFLTIPIDRGWQMTMLSRGQTMLLSVDERAVLDCRFQAQNFNLFDCPVLWRKTQAAETTMINIMGNINEPFLFTNRFDVAFSVDDALQYNLQLSIIAVSHEDSGNYSCEVRGPHSVLRGTVTHSLYVRDSVKSIVISDGDVTNEHRVIVDGGSGGHHDNRVLRLVENRASRLRCVAFGGYPTPVLLLYVGRRNVTDRFSAGVEASLAGERGLRQIRLRTDRWTDNYTPSSDDDGLKFKCIATVAEMNSYTEFVHISVEYGPKLSCVGAEAYLGERNVVLKCEIKAKPPPTRFYWVVDANGTTITDQTNADKTSDYHVITAIRSDDVIEAHLIIRHVRLDLFRNFSMFAENILSVSSKDIFLSQKYNTYRSRDPLPDVSNRRFSSFADLRRGTVSSSTSSPHLLIHLPPEHPLQTPLQISVAVITLTLIYIYSQTPTSSGSTATAHSY